MAGPWQSGPCHNSLMAYATATGAHGARHSAILNYRAAARYHAFARFARARGAHARAYLFETLVDERVARARLDAAHAREMASGACMEA